MPNRSRTATIVRLRSSHRTSANSPRRRCTHCRPMSSYRCSAISLSDRVRRRWPAPLEFVLDDFEIVELAVDDDLRTLVFAGDRLIAGREIDDAQPRVPKGHSPVGGYPVALSIGTPMVKAPSGPLDRGGREGCLTGEDGRNTAHGWAKLIRNRRRVDAHRPPLVYSPRRETSATGARCVPTFQGTAVVMGNVHAR